MSSSGEILIEVLPGRAEFFVPPFMLELSLLDGVVLPPRRRRKDTARYHEQREEDREGRPTFEAQSLNVVRRPEAQPLRDVTCLEVIEEEDEPMASSSREWKPAPQPSSAVRRLEEEIKEDDQRMKSCCGGWDTSPLAALGRLEEVKDLIAAEKARAEKLEKDLKIQKCARARIEKTLEGSTSSKRESLDGEKLTYDESMPNLSGKRQRQGMFGFRAWIRGYAMSYGQVP